MKETVWVVMLEQGYANHYRLDSVWSSQEKAQAYIDSKGESIRKSDYVMYDVKMDTDYSYA